MSYSPGRSNVERSLQKKGFVLVDTHHKRYIYHAKSGKKTSIMTKVSHGTSHKEIGINNLGNMAKQCRLSKAQFLDLIECHLSREGYEEFLLKNGLII